MFIFLSYGTLIVYIGSRMADQQLFLESMSKLSPSKFCHCTQSIADAFVALLWKSPVMQHKQRILRQNQHDMFYTQKTIAVQPSMAKYEWTMYQIKVD